MLFSLVLAVASKEVELWQTFDDFAPRRLMDEGEEMEAMEDPETDGDEEEPLEGDDMGGDLTEEEEEGLNPLMIAVPAAAALAVGGYFLMNQGKNEKQEDKPFTERLTMEGLQKDSEVQAAAGLTAVATGLGLYALLGSGGPTAPVSTGFLASTAGLATAGIGGAGFLASAASKIKHGTWNPYKGFITGVEPKPEGDKPEGDKPEGDKPEGDKPEGDKPEGDKPETKKKK